MKGDPKTRAAISLVFLANGTLFGNWVARIPYVAETLALSKSEIGLALLALGLGALVAMMGTSRLLCHFSSRRLVQVGALGFCAALLLPAFAIGFTSLCGALAVMGAFNGMLDISMNTQGVEYEKRYHRPILSSLHGLWSTGGLLGAATGGWAASHHVALLPHFACAAALALLLKAVILPALMESPLPSAAPSDTSPDAAFATRSGFSLALIGLGAMSFSAFMAEGAIADWSALYLRDHLGTSPGLAVAAFGAFCFFMAIVRFTGDWLLTRWSPLRLIATSAAICLGGMLLALASTTPFPAIAGFAITGIGLACIFPTLMSVAARLPGVAAPTGITTVAATGYTGFLLGPAIIGFLAETTTLQLALGIVALLSVVILLCSRAVATR